MFDGVGWLHFFCGSRISVDVVCGLWSIYGKCIDLKLEVTALQVWVYIGRSCGQKNQRLMMNYDRDFERVPVAELLAGEPGLERFRFVIPSFQRGYRWEEKQVTDLLEDIRQFADDDSEKNRQYILQPVVVKPGTDGDGLRVYEVLDGQQRLTTMLLVLKELLRGYVTQRDSERYSDTLYSINYANKPDLNFDDPDAADSIDGYYLREAVDTIKKWFDGVEDVTEMVKCLFYRGAKKQVKFIWYPIDSSGEDLVSINIFNRLNKGKISLTSSELIKALFIMDYELRAKDDRLPAQTLSMEWDEMERKFQDDKFWYFISDDGRGVQTRIDVLFDFVTCKNRGDDADYSYREFQKLYNACRKRDRNQDDSQESFHRGWTVKGIGSGQGIKNMEDAWRVVRKTFDRLVAWYEDNLYYHYVGYLVTVGFTPLEIYDYLENEKKGRSEWTTEDTKRSLRKKMMDRFRDDKKNYLTKDAVDSFEYGSEYVARTLLMFNVESCLRGGIVRFAFDKFKKESWDVEHVDSQNEATLEKYDDRMRWLKNVRYILLRENTQRSNELAAKAGELYTAFDKAQKVNETQYKDFYAEVARHYAAGAGEDETKVDLKTRNKNNIRNLTLLDSHTNREYKDAPFAYKRYLIMEYDRKGARFIPPCTRNLFLKYYSDSNTESSYLDTMKWSRPDRECYMKAIHETVDPIFDSVIVKE
jgi:hypothetical protein